MLPLSISGLSALISIFLIILLFPLMKRYALARPNARSSHTTPTPQGGGIAVLSATILVSAGFLLWLYPRLQSTHILISVAAAALLLAIIGAKDDIQPMAAGPRLLAHTISAATIVFLGLEGIRILPILPYWLELLLLTLAITWFVNLTNFMDGLDLILVAAKLPILAALALFSLGGYIPAHHGIIAAALAGALIGFAPFNRPVAKLFLGDVGSLPIGLLVGWLLLVLASKGHLVAAIILPLYFCADATITLFRRLARKERVWEAHRTHFYQRATTNGYTPLQVATHVFLLNLALAGLASATILWPSAAVLIGASLLSALLLALCLMRFAQPKNSC